MRRIMIVGAITALSAVMAAPAQAATVKVRHFAPVPCAVMCAYWDVPETAGFNECEAPFPEGSYDMSTFELTAKTGTVHVSARSAVDYDSFICTNTNPPVLVFSMANIIGDECDGIGGRNAVAVGCLEEGDLTYNALVATNGGANEMQFIIISYNWSDADAIDVVLEGPVKVIKDNFSASCPAELC